LHSREGACTLADITMPQLGETVTEGTIIRWLKAVGDTVAQDEPLFEVSTDKVDSEVPSPAAGVLSEILVQEGETVDVGARLAVVGGEMSGSTSAPAQPAPANEVFGEAAEQSAPTAAPPLSPPPDPQPSPLAPPPAAVPEPAISSQPVSSQPVSSPAMSSGGGGNTQFSPPTAPAPSAAAPVEQPPASPPGATSGNGAPPGSNGIGGTRGALLSPVVRRLISENQIDPGEIPGTGMGGRITREDVVRYIEEKGRRPGAEERGGEGGTYAPVPAAASPAPPTGPRPVTTSLAATSGGPRDEVVPFSSIRRVTAEHMVRSKATSAHTLVAVEADFERVDRVRRAHKDRFRADEGISLTYLPFVARAVVDVLRQYPNLNSSVGDEALVIHRDVHLGFAVDLAQEGLIVPVLHNADGQSVRGIARSVADLAARARARKLSADDITGGTFTTTGRSMGPTRLPSCGIWCT